MNAFFPDTAPTVVVPDIRSSAMLVDCGVSCWSGNRLDREATEDITINSGAGGTESQDWAEMLLRMYTRWCERAGFDLEQADFQVGDEAGIKSATLFCRGEYAYGWLRAEDGVHRIVRISPFDSNARRQTAFAAVLCFPVLRDAIHSVER